MKNVMAKAWEIAREGVRKFGGKVKQYFAVALKMAWDEVKEATKSVEEKALEAFDKIARRWSNRDAEQKITIWEKGAHKRIYLNVYKQNTQSYVYIDVNTGNVFASNDKNSTMRNAIDVYAQFVITNKEYFINKYAA